MEKGFKTIMNININTFNEWAKLGKDKSMAKNHESSVDRMFEIINEKSKFNDSFNFLDLGCGNGWVIRKIMEYKNCISATGLDGSENMINIANSYKIGNFYKENIEQYTFKKKFDIIFSMETLYYIKNVDNLLNDIYLNGLNNGGLLIIGIDHYKENIPSLNWGNDYNLDINTYSINQWQTKFINCNFKNVSSIQHDKKNDWEGTLIISAEK